MTYNEKLLLGLISTAGQLIQNTVLSDETKFSKYWTEDNLQWKKTSNFKTKISQQLLVRSFLNPKHIHKWQNKTPMEDDLKYQKWYISAATGL